MDPVNGPAKTAHRVPLARVVPLRQNVFPHLRGAGLGLVAAVVVRVAIECNTPLECRQ